MDSNIFTQDVLRYLYYTENSSMLKFSGKTYNRGLLISPKVSKYSDLYFHTGNIAGEASKIGGVFYVDESVKKLLKEVTVTFRKSKDENEEVSALYIFTPGEPF